MDDIVTGLPERKPVQLRVARARKVSGLDLTLADCTERLRPAGPVLRRGRAGRFRQRLRRRMARSSR